MMAGRNYARVLIAIGVLSTCAEEVSPFGNGGLAFRDLGVSFTPRIVYSGWKGQSRAKPGAGVGSFAFDLSDGPGGVF